MTYDSAFRLEVGMAERPLAVRAVALGGDSFDHRLLVVRHEERDI